jgi:aldehyde dehydrogenase (NAD+)
VRALLEVGVPGDVVQVVHGAGARIGEALACDERVAAVSFTGSTRVGHHLRRTLPPATRLQAELGGKNPLVVTRDADLELATRLVVDGALTSTGQMCTATSIVLVDQAIEDDLAGRLASAFASVLIGPGLDQDTWMGPLAGEDRLADVNAAIESACRRGVEVEGGRRLGGALAAGCFVTPALARGARADDSLLLDEIFGPVVALVPFSTLDEAIARANATRYGLSASICTRDLHAAHRFAREIRAGMVGVNVATAGWELQLPFGGLKDSGLGTKEQGHEGLEFFLVRRTVAIAG